jgi:RNA polymerase sigma factor (sigma-70 family)
MPTGPRADANGTSNKSNSQTPLTGGFSDDELLSHLAVAERAVAFVCARHRLTGDEADDFSSHVTLRLLDDDRAILRKFAGRSSIRTYLGVVIERLFLDYRTAAWGKWRPSAEATRRGETAILLERLLSRDGYTFEEAYEVLTTNYGVTVSRAGIEELAARLPVKVKRRFEGEASLGVVADTHSSPEETLVDRARATRELEVAALLKRTTAELSPRDQLLLALRYEDGRTVAEIAAVLREDQKRLYRHYDSLLRDLRSRLESRGVHANEVAALFADVGIGGGVESEIADGPTAAAGARK